MKTFPPSGPFGIVVVAMIVIIVLGAAAVFAAAVTGWRERPPGERG